MNDLREVTAEHYNLLLDDYRRLETDLAAKTAELESVRMELDDVKLMLKTHLAAGSALREQLAAKEAELKSAAPVGSIARKVLSLKAAKQAAETNADYWKSAFDDAHDALSSATARAEKAEAKFERIRTARDEFYEAAESQLREARAEIERLRELVRRAIEDGWKCSDEATRALTGGPTP